MLESPLNNHSIQPASSGCPWHHPLLIKSNNTKSSIKPCFICPCFNYDYDRGIFCLYYFNKRGFPNPRQLHTKRFMALGEARKQPPPISIFEKRSLLKLVVFCLVTLRNCDSCYSLSYLSNLALHGRSVREVHPGIIVIQSMYPRLLKFSIVAKQPSLDLGHQRRC